MKVGVGQVGQYAVFRAATVAPILKQAGLRLLGYRDDFSVLVVIDS
jgi:hypothetical protein